MFSHTWKYNVIVTFRIIYLYLLKKTLEQTAIFTLDKSYILQSVKSINSSPALINRNK